MSLVGTRPPTVDEWEQYELHHRSRMSIKPGITGMWQASGRSDITDFEEVVKLDTEYIEKYCNRVKALPSMQGFFSICEYLQITPGDFFNEDSEAPREVRELMEKIEKLTPEQRTLIRQVVEQFLGE